MVLGEVKQTFNPEFINRIDEIIVFEALSDDDLRTITRLLVEQLNDNLVDRKLQLDARRRRSSTGSSSRPARTARTARVRCAGRSSATSRIRSPRSSSAGTSRAATSRSISTAGVLAYRPAGQRRRPPAGLSRRLASTRRARLRQRRDEPQGQLAGLTRLNPVNSWLAASAGDPPGAGGTESAPPFDVP